MANAGEQASFVREIICCVFCTSLSSLTALTSHYRDHCNEQQSQQQVGRP